MYKFILTALCSALFACQEAAPNDASGAPDANRLAKPRPAHLRKVFASMRMPSGVAVHGACQSPPEYGSESGSEEAAAVCKAWGEGSGANPEFVDLRPGGLIKLNAPVDGRALTGREDLFRHLERYTSDRINIRILVDEADHRDFDTALPRIRHAVQQFVESLDLIHHVLDAPRRQDLTLAFSSRLRPENTGIFQVIGQFNPADRLPPTFPGATKNQADIIWLYTPNVPGISNELLTSALIHEYTHLAVFGIRCGENASSTMPEEVWLNEGIADLMEEVAGWGTGNLAAQAYALLRWPAVDFIYGEDTIYNRGATSLFMRHILDQRAKAKGIAYAADPRVVDVARDLLAPLAHGQHTGVCHAAFSDLTPEDLSGFLWALWHAGTEPSPRPAFASKQFLLPGILANGQSIGFIGRGRVKDGHGDEIELPRIHLRLHTDDALAQAAAAPGYHMHLWSVDARDAADFRRACEKHGLLCQEQELDM